MTVLSIPLGPLPPLGDLLEPRGGFWTTAGDAIPPGHQILNFPGLENPVEVFRDEYGIPHLFAEGDLDLYRAVGYVQAFDRLFQMDMQRRASKGELSEILGSSFVETDRFLRVIGLPWAAENSLQAADNETLEVVEAYSEGVNSYIREVSPLDLPLEFKLLNYVPEPWEPLDSFALGKFMGWSLSGGFEDLQLQLFRDAYGQEAVDELFPIDGPFPLPIVPSEPSGISHTPAPRWAVSSPQLSGDLIRHILAQAGDAMPVFDQFGSMGSNNWAVSGARSATGAPILANDPHLGLTVPAIWYMLRLSSPSFNVYGVSLLGFPVPVLGYNRNIAWGFTNTGADVVDFFIEEVRPDNELQYLYRGQWADFLVREEVIGVKGASSVTVQLRISEHGPVISSLDVASGYTDTISMQWTGHRPTQELRAILDLARATDWSEFRTAIAAFQVPAQNIIYADAEGSIGIVVNGLFPIRAMGRGRFPVDGSSGDHDWMGFVPLDQVPSSLNPDQGYLVSANQLPTLESGPYLGWTWADRYRAARINEVLNLTDKVSVEDVKALQLDHVSVAARELVPFLLSAFEGLADGGASLHARAPEAVDRLGDWNYDMDIKEVTPTLYTHWLQKYREATFGDEWSAGDLEGVRFPSTTTLENLTKFHPFSRWFDDVRTTEVEGRDDIICQAFAGALAELEQNFTTNMDTWKWGDVHVLQLLHPTELKPLSSAAVPRAGGMFTVDVAGASLSDGRFLVTSGPSWRLVVDFSTAMAGAEPTAFGVYPGGQSGRALSPHYLDLFELWMSGDYVNLGLMERSDFQASSSPGG